ncbi:hypothetical protein Dimus_034102 [Dionaea muscipula]
MGNYVSCALVGATVKNKAAVVTKVILPTGEIEIFYEPTKAAELMFDMPNFFLVNSQSLRIGTRFSALSADEELEMGNVYAMFPMKRLNSVVSAADIGALFLIAKKGSSGGGGGGGAARIVPELVGVSEVSPAAATTAGGREKVGAPRLDLENVAEVSSPEFRYRLSICRSKKPILETIVEEPVCSR